jgi:hypothetical protein
MQTPPIQINAWLSKNNIIVIDKKLCCQLSASPIFYFCTPPCWQSFAALQKKSLTMRLSFSRTLAVSALLSCCSAFSPTTSFARTSTNVQATISSKWTMMPDEPAPEVRRSFHVASVWCIARCWPLCITIKHDIVFSSLSIVLALSIIGRSPAQKSR